MAHKKSDLLQDIQNTQIRIAIDRLLSLAGVNSSTKSGDPITTDITGDLTGDVTGQAAGSEIFASVATTAVDGEDGTAAVQLVFKDINGTTITQAVAGTFYISEVATGLTRDPADTGIAVLTNGVVQNIDAAVQNGWHFVTTAAGLLGMTITANADSYWVVFVAPSGKLIISDEVTITSGG